MGGVYNGMKNLYDITRHLVWLTQFGLSVCAPLVLFVLGAVWLQKNFALDGWVVVIGIALGILGAVGGLRTSLKAIEQQGRQRSGKRPPPTSFNSH